MLCIFYTNIFHSPTIWYKRATVPIPGPSSTRVGGRLFVLLPKVIMPWHSVYTALCCILCGWLKVSLYNKVFFLFYFPYYFCCIFFLFFLWLFLHSVLSVLFCLKNFKRVIFAICLIAKSQRSRRRLWMATVTVSNDERDREEIVQERWRRKKGGRVFSFSVAHAQSAFKSILIAMFTPRRHIARTFQDATAKRRLQLKIYLLPLLLLLFLILLLLLLHLFVHFFICLFYCAPVRQKESPLLPRVSYFSSCLPAAFSRLCIINQFTFSLTTRKNEMQITATNRERCSIWGCRVGSSSKGEWGRRQLRLRAEAKGNGAATLQQHHFSPQRFTRT